MRLWAVVLVLSMATTAVSAKGGRDVYEATCAACHATGVAGAPKYGDKAQWAARATSGREALAASVIQGKGAMPPRGGDARLSDSEIRNAVDFMLKAVR
jgi:cytochrome c5